MQRGYAMHPYQYGELSRIKVRVRCRNDQLSSGYKWPKELPDRNVKTEWCFLQNNVLFRQMIGLLHPAETVGQTAVSVSRAFRFAGRSRGKDCVGQLFGFDSDGRART